MVSPSAPGGRPVNVQTRLSLEETAWLDRERKALSRSQYLRWLILRERKRQNGA